jgi:hypothetical protein
MPGAMNVTKKNATEKTFSNINLYSYVCLYVLSLGT